MEEVIYEGFGPKGVSFIVEAVTDNKNRTTSEVQNIFNKNSGTMGQPGSVAYQFNQKGRIILNKNGKSVDEIFLASADAGAEDVEEAGNEVFVYTNPQQLGNVAENLEKLKLSVKESELIRVPLTHIAFSTEMEAEPVISLIEKLENLDDVQKVYTNLEIA